MKSRLYHIAALALVFSAVSCTGIDPEKTGGDAITFSIATGYDSSSTKTSYSGVTAGDPAKERIDWVIGDKFKLSCAQTTPTSFSYEITGGITPDGAISRATKIVPVGHPNANGLQWGTGTHHFYAVYPSTATLTASGQITATIPAVQAHSSLESTPRP